MELVKWNEIETRIQTTKDIKELSKIKNVLEGIKVMAAQHGGSKSTQNKAALYSIEVEMKMGAIYKDAPAKRGRKTSDASDELTIKQDIISEIGREPQTVKQYAAEAKANEKTGAFDEYKKEVLANIETYDCSSADFRRYAKPEKEPSDYPWFIYNIWNLKEGDGKEYFGAFPGVFMENLLHFHTQEGDLVFDPFAGSGTTIDACKKLKRKYDCYDIRPARKEIKEWDARNGIPKDIETPELAFIDPPYWKQAKGQYADQSIASMSLGEFTNLVTNLLDQMAERKFPLIALVIQGTQWLNDNHEYVDHEHDFHAAISDKYKVLMRYILPYSSQQYTPQQVITAKKENFCLVLHRDLVVWKLR